MLDQGLIWRETENSGTKLNGALDKNAKFDAYVRKWMGCQASDLQSTLLILFVVGCPHVLAAICSQRLLLHSP